MNSLLIIIFRLYLPIGVAISIGILLSCLLKKSQVKIFKNNHLSLIIPNYLGKFLFWFGVPLGVINFIHKANLSGGIWLSPIVAWCAVLLGLFLSWLLIQTLFPKPSLASQTSFTLVSTVGNTGYIGFPIILLLPQLGPDYFGWAILYDLLGTFLAAYGLGTILASRNLLTRNKVINFGSGLSIVSIDQTTIFHSIKLSLLQIVRWLQNNLVILVKNPTLIAFVLGLTLRSIVFPPWLDISLEWFAWSIIMLSLILMGMRLQQLDSWSNIKIAFSAVSIKMLLVPLVIAMALTTAGLSGPPRLVLVLQSAMPSAFASLILAEAYDLDRDLVVTCLGLSSLMLFFTLPFWLWGFTTW
ncbi:AEC family transporter [Synechocystis sp. LEGE 06083]|uniref:AEC family transporter n=1 Tax=Synechocystis sp. LEGE 06083 TaxID=915336 RepID=UPI0018825146|nr:AEC family transporter [Synechocystis sp. LEGE 06083]MBE9196626.1 AEC family transporter [Synechocystis sp. LEGE 06083]